MTTTPETSDKKRKIDAVTQTSMTKYWMVFDCDDDEYEVMCMDLSSAELPWKQCREHHMFMEIETILSEDRLRKETIDAVKALHNEYLVGVDSSEDTENSDDPELRIIILKVVCADVDIC